MFQLNDLGFDPHTIPQLCEKGLPGRISGESHGVFTVLAEEGEIPCRLTGRSIAQLTGTINYPITGDFIIADKDHLIREILPRRGLLSRGDAFSVSYTEALAANCDYIFVVVSLNQDFNERKIRRFLIAAAGSGAQPVLILTKADLNSEEENRAFTEKARHLTALKVILTRSDQKESVSPLIELLKGGRTAALLGASGVGKSTLINLIAGEEIMKTADIRQSDDQGRHTTTHREILVIPGIGCLIDTPGLRRLYIQDVGDAVDEVFGELAGLMKQCRYTDCTHTKEPGCAVQAAILQGEVKAEELEEYRAMQKEAQFFEAKARLREKEQAKRVIRGQKKPRRKTWSDTE